MPRHDRSAFSDAGNIGPILGIYKLLTGHMNVEIRTEAAQFPEKEYINGIFVAVRKIHFCKAKYAASLYVVRNTIPLAPNFVTTVGYKHWKRIVKVLKYTNITRLDLKFMQNIRRHYTHLMSMYRYIYTAYVLRY